MEVCCGFEVEWKEEQGIYYSGKALVLECFGDIRDKAGRSDKFLIFGRT